ncbi:MAG: hypothetical protein WHV66_04780 [Anaerolineales bacterium]
MLLLSYSNQPLADPGEQVRVFTRPVEFDFFSWMTEAVLAKSLQTSLDLPRFLTEEKQIAVVQTCLSLVYQSAQLNAQIEAIYADPNISTPEQNSKPYREWLEKAQEYQSVLAPLCETILQQQTSFVLSKLNLTLIGQPIPPVLYHVTPLPYALIVSPREVIRQDANISLEHGLSLEEMVTLEKRVESSLNVSALVVRIGGIGIYPTMIMSTSDLPFLTETIAHEWVHNFLTLRPLGLNYETSPELRTMNETTASLAGKEIGRAVLEQYYPEFLPEEPLLTNPAGNSPPQSQPAAPVFDFRKEMHETRVTVDKLLQDGKVEEAESYMEMRRQVFLANGYLIRRLNQAYFAFHGAYADEPGGAAGEDPVGPAVRALRARSSSLAEFLNRMSWMTSFEQLQEAIK